MAGEALDLEAEVAKAANLVVEVAKVDLVVMVVEREAE